MSQILGQCVGLISTERWRSVRSVVEIPFLHKTSTQHILPILSHTASYIKDIGNLKDGLLDPVEDIKLLPFWIVARIIYGELSQEQIKELKALMPCRENLFRQVIRGGLSRFLWSKYLPSQVNSALAHFRARWAAFNEAAYSRAASYDKTLPIVGMFEAVKCGELSLEQLYQTLDESLFANLDVTTGALSWNLVFLAANKKTQALLLQEIHENIDDLESYILSPSTYLAACINESSRLKPLAPFSVPQSAPTDRTIEGYTIPGGTSFVVDSYALNIHNDYWGPDRTVYRPERWSELKSKDLRYHFWRFGFGPRQCMGKYVADFMVRSLLVELLKEYDLGLLKDNGDWATNPESWILFPKLKLTVLRRAH
jgi:cytochrome P450